MKKNIRRRVIAIASAILLFSLFGCRLIETNLTAKVKWKFNTNKLSSGSTTNNFINNLLVSEETIYFSALFFKKGPSTSGVYALDGNTGKFLWKFDTGEEEPTEFLKIAANLIYFKSGANTFYALDKKSGKVKWKIEGQEDIEKKEDIDAVKVTKGEVFLKTATPSIELGRYRNNLYALDAQTGKQKWKFETGGFTIRGISLVGKVIYISSATKSPGKPDWLDGTLHAVNIGTGQEKWRYETGKGKGERIKLDSLIVSGRTFYFATGGDTLDGETPNPPIIGNVYAIQPKE